LQKEDPTIAELLKPLGYTSGQFGKNHLGDRDEFLPTAHGFDEFYGNLYHLNAEEEPEDPDYPKDANRVPAMIRWPGKVKPGTIENGMFSAMDWMPSLLAAAGVADIKEKLLKGYQAGDKSFKVHLDGYNQMDLLQGKGKSNREEFFYFSDAATLNAVRWGDWKMHFTIMEDWISGKITKQTFPKVVNLRQDPFER
jgi:arylsulfatase A-like enzyme